MAAHSGNWRIELCERPVKKYRSVDYILFGRGLSHPFLVLIDAANIVRGELHGVPHDPAHDTYKSRLSRIFEYSAALTTPVGLDLMVRDMAAMTPLARAFPVVRSRHYNKARQYKDARVRQIVLAGPPINMLAIWQQMREAASRIDALNMDYNRYGWGNGRYNCQTMIAGILDDVNVNATLSQVYAAPGWKKPAANVYTPLMGRRRRAGYRPVNP